MPKRDGLIFRCLAIRSNSSHSRIRSRAKLAGRYGNIVVPHPLKHFLVSVIVNVFMSKALGVSKELVDAVVLASAPPQRCRGDPAKIFAISLSEGIPGRACQQCAEFAKIPMPPKRLARHAYGKIHDGPQRLAALLWIGRQLEIFVAWPKIDNGRCEKQKANRDVLMYYIESQFPSWCWPPNRFGHRFLHIDHHLRVNLSKTNFQRINRK